MTPSSIVAPAVRFMYAALTGSSIGEPVDVLKPSMLFARTVVLGLAAVFPIQTSLLGRARIY